MFEKTARLMGWERLQQCAGNQVVLAGHFLDRWGLFPTRLEICRTNSSVRQIWASVSVQIMLPGDLFLNGCGSSHRGDNFAIYAHRPELDPSLTLTDANKTQPRSFRAVVYETASFPDPDCPICRQPIRFANRITIKLIICVIRGRGHLTCFSPRQRLICFLRIGCFNYECD